MESVGILKRGWLGEFLALPNGIPAHDTFGRAFALIEPRAFEACFRTWVETIRQVIPGEIIREVQRDHRRSASARAAAA